MEFLDLICTVQCERVQEAKWERERGGVGKVPRAENQTWAIGSDTSFRFMVRFLKNYKKNYKNETGCAFKPVFTSCEVVYNKIKMLFEHHIYHISINNVPGKCLLFTSCKTVIAYILQNSLQQLLLMNKG